MTPIHVRELEPRCAEQAHRDRRRGRSATPAPGSRCSPSPACPATRRRRSPTPRTVHRFTGVAPTRGAAHPVGQGRRLRRRWPRTPRTSASRSARSTPTCSRTTTTSSAALTHPDPAVRRKAIDHLLECVDVMDADRLARPEDVVLRRHQLPGPGRHARPARTGWPRRCARSTPGSATDQRLLLEYKLFEPAFYTTDVPDWGTSLRALPGARRPGHGRASTPATTRPAPTSSSSSRSCCGPGSSAAFDFNSPLLRRRRPDGRRGRPVPAVPDHARDRPAATRSARRPASRSCSTSATTSSRRSPARSARCMNVQEATAKALLVDRDALARGPAGRRRARRQRRAHGRLQHRRPPAAAPAARGAWASTPTRSPPTAAPATRSRSPRERVGGTQAGWGA